MTPVKAAAIGLLASVLMVGVVTFYLTREHKALLDARQQAEAATLKLKGQIVADAESKALLRADTEKLLAENAALRAAVEAAKAVSPGAEVVGSADLRTGNLAVHTLPRSGNPPPIAPRPVQDPPPAAGRGVPSPDKFPPGSDLAPSCVLTDVDTINLRVQAVALKAREGSLIISGIASAWRDNSKLAEGPFSSAVSDVNEQAQATAPRWGAALLGECEANGCRAGAAVLFPPLFVLGARVEAQAGAYLAPFGVHGAVGIRW